MSRALCTIRKIQEVKPIDGADQIEAARVDGWWVVVKKGEFPVGSLALYFEIDSWIPSTIAAFLTRAGHVPKEYNGIKGERLKTIKLKGQRSQGLLLSIPVELQSTAEEGKDYTAELGIQKWEPPESTVNAAGAKQAGNFPYFIPKTDQERVQNLKKALTKWAELDTTWEVTEKLDGSSGTYFSNPLEAEEKYQTGVCSRNFLLQDEPEKVSIWHEVQVKQNILEKIKSTGRALAFQGEIIGPGVQGNKYGLTERVFYCYDIFDISSQKYLTSFERKSLCEELGIQQVPWLGEVQIYTAVTRPRATDPQFYLELAEGTSVLSQTVLREGLVFKCTSAPEHSFKAINNSWLEKYD